MRGGHFWASWCTAESQGADRRHCYRRHLSFSSGYITADWLWLYSAGRHLSVSLTPRQHMSSCFFPAHSRTDGHRGELTNDGRQDSVWSAQQLEAASVVAPSTPIDWAAIRQNKQKYEELKWKGQSVCVCPPKMNAQRRLTNLGHAVDLFDYCLSINWHRYCEPFNAMLLINLCVCHYRQTCHPWKRTFTLRLRAYPCWRQRTLANGGHFIFILFCGCGCYSVDFSFVVHRVDNSLWFVLLKQQQKNNYNLS